MPIFLYEAVDSSGQKIRQKIEAQDKKSAVANIRKKGLRPTGIKEVTDGSGGGGEMESTAPSMDTAEPTGRKRGGTGGVPRKLLTEFSTQLSILQNAGLPIVRSLKIMQGQQKHSTFKKILTEVAEDVENGQQLSEAMSKHARCFNKLYVNMVKAGEAGGVLDTILERLSVFLESEQALKRKVLGAMIYPIVVLSVTVLILTGIILFVIPTFKEMFGDMGIQLPGPTQMLITISDFLIGFWFLIPAIPIGIYVGFKAWIATEKGRYQWDSIKLKLPVLGNITRKSTIARFTRTLGTLFASGVPVLEALAIVKNAIGNEVLTRAIDQVYESIREGDNFSDPLAASELFDDLVINMVDVGEETGELDKMLLKIADQYEQEVEIAVDGLTSAIEPLLIVFMGGSVGFIVVSLFMPLVSIMTNLNPG